MQRSALHRTSALSDDGGRYRLNGRQPQAEAEQQDPDLRTFRDPSRDVGRQRCQDCDPDAHEDDRQRLDGLPIDRGVPASGPRDKQQDHVSESGRHTGSRTDPQQEGCLDRAGRTPAWSGQPLQGSRVETHSGGNTRPVFSSNS